MELAGVCKLHTYYFYFLCASAGRTAVRESNRHAPHDTAAVVLDIKSYFKTLGATNPWIGKEDPPPFCVTGAAIRSKESGCKNNNEG